MASLMAELAASKAENERLKAGLAAKGKLGFKVSEKGALSVLGLQRFPVTLYREQWERLIEATPQLQAFMAANTKLFSVKAPKVQPPTPAPAGEAAAAV